MKQYTHSYRINLSSEDMQYIDELKKLKIKPTTFIRIAFNEKIQRELKGLKLKKEKIIYPF